MDTDADGPIRSVLDGQRTWTDAATRLRGHMDEHPLGTVSAILAAFGVRREYCRTAGAPPMGSVGPLFESADRIYPTKDYTSQCNRRRQPYHLKMNPSEEAIERWSSGWDRLARDSTAHGGDWWWSYFQTLGPDCLE